MGDAEDSGSKSPGQQQSPAAYEEQFTAFIDFLGFSEVSKQVDDTARLQILELLRSIAELRSEFDVHSEPHEGGGSRHWIIPAVSTFSDHIVVSYPLERVARDLNASIDDAVVVLMVLNGFGRLLRRIAASALRLGLLIRGGVAIGKLYHSQGVVFGEAMIEAYELESRVAVYPRVVLSPRLAARQSWTTQHEVAVSSDGLHHVDYFSRLPLSAVAPGNDYTERTKAWFQDVIAIIANKHTELRKDGKLKELANWVWFSREFRRGVEVIPAGARDAFGVPLSAIPWS